jgi:hypothetical protein
LECSLTCLTDQQKQDTQWPQQWPQQKTRWVMSEPDFFNH